MRCIFFFFLLALFAPALAFAQKAESQAKVDSLENVVETTEDPAAKAESLCQLCWQLRIAGQPEAALEKGEAGSKFARETGDRKNEATCLNSIGVVYLEQGDYARALEYFEQSLKIFEETGDRKGEASCLKSIGVF